MAKHRKISDGLKIAHYMLGPYTVVIIGRLSYNFN